ncbi:MAG: hypothetical protein U9Q81_07775 [Pseudomonadota bacterium]|nr:hypothetical protein [Pseudomonadota bacterium]
MYAAVGETGLTGGWYQATVASEAAQGAKEAAYNAVQKTAVTLEQVGTYDLRLAGFEHRFSAAEDAVTKVRQSVDQQARHNAVAEEKATTAQATVRPFDDRISALELKISRVAGTIEALSESADVTKALKILFGKLKDDDHPEH